MGQVEAEEPDPLAQSTAPTCPRCGSTWLTDFEPKRGRRRVWCSDTCRRAAYAERAAASRAGTAIRVVEVPRRCPPVQRTVIVPRDINTEEAVQLVVTDPQALLMLLSSLERRIDDGHLDSAVRDKLRLLTRKLSPQEAAGKTDSWWNPRPGR
jgi:hypothetical protein